MVSAIPRKLGRAVWPSMVTALVLLAVYVSGGRLLLGALPNVQDDIESLLSQRFQFDISIGQISGTMDGFSPRLTLSDFEVTDVKGVNALQLPSVTLGIDPWQTLLARSLRFEELTLTAPQIQWPERAGAEGPQLPEDVRGALNNFKRLQIRDAEILLPTGRSNASPRLRSLIVDMDLVRDRSLRQIKLIVEAAEGRIFSAEGSGTGNPFDLSQFSGELHGHLNSLGGLLLAEWFELDLSVEGQADYWFVVEQGMPDLVVQADFKDLTVLGEPQLAIDSFSFDAAWTARGEASEVWIDNATVISGAHILEVPRTQLTGSGRSWQALTEKWNISDAVNVLTGSGLLPGKANTILETLNPRGSIDSLRLSVDSWRAPLSAWNASMAVTDATTDPYNKVPGLAGIDASITADNAGALAWINTRNFDLLLPKVYEAPIHLDSAVGRLAGRWQRGALYLEEGLFLAEASDHNGMIEFEIDIPLSKPAVTTLQMRLAVALENAPISARHPYIPYRMPAEAYAWLNSALPQGEIEQAIFLWRGGFQPYGNAGQTMQLAAELQNLELDYQANWPVAAIERAALRLSDTEIDIWAPRSRIAELPLTDTAVGIRIRPDAVAFAMKSENNSSPAEFLSGLQKLPALDVAGSLMNDLTLTGESGVNADVFLGFDLRDVGNTLDIDFSADFDDIAVISQFLDIQADNVSGPLSYRHGTGFESAGLTASVWGRPLRVVIDPDLTQAPDTILAAQIDAKADVSDLLAWQAVEIPLPVSGITAVSVAVNVADDISVGISSELRGVTVDMPLPWGKSAQASAPLQVIWRDRDWAAWEIFWFGRFSAVVDAPELGQLAAHLDVTPRTRPPKSSGMSPKPGLGVTGHLPSLDLADWESFIKSLSGPPSTLAIPARAQDLRVSRLLWRGQELGSLDIHLRSDADQLLMDLDLPWLGATYSQERRMGFTETDGGVDAPTERVLRLTYLDLDRLPQFGDEMVDGQLPDPESGLGRWMRQLPVEIERVRRGSTDLGNLQLTIDYLENDGWRFQDIEGNFLGVQWLPSTYIAWRAEGEEATALTLAAELNDIAGSLELVGVSPIAETRGGRIDANWHWPGSPQDFQLTAVSGTLDLEMQSGSFLSANSEATGVLRLLSLLNLSGLFRRANMNQLFDPGVTFDRAVGRFEFDQGLMRIPDFSIEGSGGYFNFTSDVDLLNETLNGELVVTLPLVENIPWVAALAGGLPVAAGTYLVSKVFEDQVNQLSSGVYSVSGSLEEPEVVFERVFDAKTRMSPTAAQGSSDAESASSVK